MSYQESDILRGSDDFSYSEKPIAKEQAEHDQQVRKRLDEILEQKRLKAMFDDEEDWELD
ncbi:PA3496 family putative envelope integrity protein [Thalassotalea agarivorans]|uniref:Uncharacterized protein n=1 Tax=Thalassotalea agarivorans TaxID=349064 RepID=A0A1H9ZC48_THASX|nr:hypothetical protein [Thalassotalea agarivorans]SES79119.1 hypothetical protein SAMN05660429_00394 [Thalassotalea agarivorans]